MKGKFKTPDPRKAKRYFSRKVSFSTDPIELGRWLKERKDIKILDVRDAKSFAKGHLPGAVHLPEERWSKAGALDKKRTYIVYGDTLVSRRAARAALELASQGLPVMELEGGFESWKELGRPVEKRSAPPRKPPASQVPAEPVEEAKAVQPEEEPPQTIAAEAN